MTLRLGIDCFTSTQVARRCGVDTRKAVAYIDSGRLKGYRIPPLTVNRSPKGHGDRRVLRADLIAFLKDHNMPLGDLIEDAESYRTLLLGLPQDAADRLEAILTPFAGFRFQRANTALRAGLLMAEFKPQAVILDFAHCGRAEAIRLAKDIRGFDPSLKLIALAGEDEVDTLSLMADGFNAVLFAPVDGKTLVAEIEGMANPKVGVS